MNKLFYPFFLLIFFASGSLRASTESDLSPVYEEVFANEVFSLWRGLAEEGKVREKEKFFVVGFDEEKDRLASRIVSSLERNHPESAQWEIGGTEPLEEGEPFRGVILMRFDMPKEIEGVASVFQKPGNEGFLLIFSDRYVNRPWLESNIEDADLKVLAVIAERELEFVEDELGRQIVDLDDPKWRGMIYERLVQEGMNPVRAHPATDEAIRQFRKSRKSKVIILGKG